MEIYKSKNIFKKIEKLLYALAGQGAVYIYEQYTEDGYKSTNGVVKTLLEMFLPKRHKKLGCVIVVKNEGEQISALCKNSENSRCYFLTAPV